MYSNIQLAATGTEVQLHDVNGKDLNGFSWCADTPEQSLKMVQRSISPIPHSSCIYRKSIFKEVGGYSKWDCTYDVELFLKMIYAGYYVMGVSGRNHRFTNYHICPTRYTQFDKAKLLEERRGLQDKWKLEWKKWKGFKETPKIVLSETE